MIRARSKCEAWEYIQIHVSVDDDPSHSQLTSSYASPEFWKLTYSHSYLGLCENSRPETLPLPPFLGDNTSYVVWREPELLTHTFITRGALLPVPLAIDDLLVQVLKLEKSAFVLPVTTRTSK